MSKSIIFDTETTGLEEKDRIIQVGAIIVDSTPKVKPVVYDELCSCEEPIKIEAMATHGIREDQLIGKPKFEDTLFFSTLKELNNKNNYLIAHNLDFDLGMLEKYDFKNNFNLIDTLQCAKHLYEIGDQVDNYNVPNHKLQTFRYMLFSEQDEQNEIDKIKNETGSDLEIKAHDAIGDVIILKLFLKKLVEKIKAKYDLEKYSDIMSKLVSLTQEPVEIKIVNFGKHKGKAIAEIEAVDSGWIDWLFKEQQKQKIANDSKFNKDLYYTLDKIIKNRNKVAESDKYNPSSGLNF